MTCLKPALGLDLMLTSSIIKPASPTTIFSNPIPILTDPVVLLADLSRLLAYPIGRPPLGALLIPLVGHSGAGGSLWSGSEPYSTGR